MLSNLKSYLRIVTTKMWQHLKTQCGIPSSTQIVQYLLSLKHKTQQVSLLEDEENKATKMIFKQYLSRLKEDYYAYIYTSQRENYYKWLPSK